MDSQSGSKVMVHSLNLTNPSMSLHSAGDGVQVEGVPSSPCMDVEKRRMGTFNEQFCMEPGEQMGSYYISKQELYIQQ